MTGRYQSILITGATSGIGRALALNFAAPDVRLALIGRNGDRLERAAEDCRSKGANVVSGMIDVRERDAMAEWIKAVDDDAPFDLVVASAGVSSGLGVGRTREDPEAVRAVLATNLVGTLNTIEPALAPMCARGQGRIALIGSIAALRGLPYSPSYCAAKAAIHAYAESLRGGLAVHGVKVTLVAPGFVLTPLNENIVAPRPLAISADRAAQIIRNGLERQRSLIAFPRLLYWGARALSVLPTALVDWALLRAQVDIPETRE